MGKALRIDYEGMILVGENARTFHNLRPEQKERIYRAYEHILKNPESGEPKEPNKGLAGIILSKFIEDSEGWADEQDSAFAIPAISGTEQDSTNSASAYTQP